MNRAKLNILAAMGIFGTVGIFVRYIPLATATVAFFRGFLGLVFLLALMLLTGKRLDRQSLRKNLPILFLSGIALGVNWTLLFEAYRFTTVATATICYYLAPVFMVLAAPLFGERLTAKKLILSGVALVGMLFVSGVLQGGVTGGKGIVLGISAAVLYATVVLLNKRLGEIAAYDKTAVQLGVAAVVMLPYCLLSRGFDMSAMDMGSYLLLVIVCFVHTGLAYWLYFGSVKKLPNQTVAIFSYLDPVIAIFLSALLLREPIGWQGIIGAVLILGSALCSELLEQKS